MYACEKCGKSFPKKWRLQRHIESKRSCIKIDATSSNNSDNQKYPKITKNNQKITKNNQKITDTQNIDIVTPLNVAHDGKRVVLTPRDLDINLDDIKILFSCSYCDKTFKYKCSLSRHINTLRCKEITKKYRNNILINRKNKKILEINQKNEKNNKSSAIVNNSNNSNNTITNVINNLNNNINNHLTINLNPFGKENLESISEEDKIKTLNQLYLAFPKALETIHFNVLENRNFYLANKKDKQYITYYNGKNFIYENSFKFKDSLCNKLMEHIEGWFNEYENHLLKSKKNMLTKVFDEFYDGKLDDKYNKEIDKYLMTYSDDIKSILKETIKKVKSEKQIKNLQKLQEQIERITINQ